MKSTGHKSLFLDRVVAPLAGAWIEIAVKNTVTKFMGVAPLAGAWIEIPRYLDAKFLTNVAPLAGAWIEIDVELQQ